MILIAYDVKRYRNLLAEVVRKGDVVLELGPHRGKSTLAYLEKAARVVAVDKSPEAAKSFEGLCEGHKNLEFVRGDVRSFSTIEKVLKLIKRCDVLAVDMGGGRFPDTVFKVWATWSGVFKPRDSVIRNRGLAEFLQRARIADNSLLRSFEDEGWLAEWGRATPQRLKQQLEEFSFWVEVEE